MSTTVLILIVDDEETSRTILGDQIKVLGHEPIFANCGRSALDIIKLQTPELILLDIIMPDMDGFFVLEQIKKDPVSSHVPVIMISAVEEMGSIVKCLEIGADDYMIKPFSPRILKTRIECCLKPEKSNELEE